MMAASCDKSSPPPHKKAKLNKGALYKPPTNEELNTLKETENLYQSNLFRMQMEELICEVQVKEKRKKLITQTLQDLNNILSNLPTQEVTEVTDLSWLPEDIKLPVAWERSQVRGQMSFQKPASVKVVGSFLLDALAKPDLNIDLAVEIPQCCRRPKDFLNFRYHHKRALYCAYLANQLRCHDLIEDVKYCWKNGDPTRPIVMVKLTGKAIRNIDIRLHPCLPEEYFKLSRLIPGRNNIRKQWYSGDSEIEETFPGTPYYNTSILADMSMERHLHCLYNAAKDFLAFKDGILLLKVWLHQRQLDQGSGAFTGFIASMLVAYLLSKRSLNKLMSGYQVFRNTVLHLAGSDWTTSGISLCKDSSTKNLPTIATFHEHFDVVFLDDSGHLNLCGNMTKATFYRVRHEANLAKGFLDSKTTDGFACLFVTPVPFITKFDHIFHFSKLSQLKESIEHLKPPEGALMDHCGDYVGACLPRLLQLLHRSLGSRVDMIAVKLQRDKQWSVSEPPPNPEDRELLTFGLLLNPDYASSVLERGPEANTPEAEEFRAFWGERSELRRFQDGSICEAVVWSGETAAAKRLICSHIIKHILKLHGGISPDSVTYIGGQLDSILSQPSQSKPHTTPTAKPQDTGDPYPGTGEEQNTALIQVYNEFTKDLRNLKEFPLTMTSVQGISPALRCTEVFLPTPVRAQRTSQHARIHSYVQVPISNQPCPDWVPAIKVICQLEGSGKWPDDLAAVQRIKAAFHIRLADMLHEQCKLVTMATPKYLDVLKEGYVFRVEVAHKREVGLLKETKTSDGLKLLRDNAQSLELERRTIMMPRFTNTLHGIQQQHTSFSGTVRLAKRWVRSHLLSNHVPEECLDLLAAYLFLHPVPCTVPCSPLVGFLRFLHLLSTHDWQTVPIIVNLNNEMKDSDYEEIYQHFSEQRNQLPHMFLATPTDKVHSVWTTKQPTVQILQRMTVLAKESLRVLTSQMMEVDASIDFKQIFRPPLDLYDVVIHLQPKLVPRRAEDVDGTRVRDQSSSNAQSVASNTRLPVVNFDPVKFYVKELEAAYSDLALFFYDWHGGSFIAVLWNPKAFQPLPFKILQAKGMMPQQNAPPDEAKMTPNVEAILEDFQVLGQGLVQSLEVRTEKWVI